MEHKKSQALVEHFYNKVKGNFKDKIVDQVSQDEKGAYEHLNAVFGEYFIKQMSLGAGSGDEDDEYYDEIDNSMTDD